MPTNITLPKEPWRCEAEEVLASLAVSPDKGLAATEIETRRDAFGPNRLRQARRQSAWRILIEQFKSLVVILLAAAAVVSFAFGEWIDGSAILVVVLINAAIGFFTELRAVRSMEALREMGSVDATVRRDGRVQQVPAEALTPGDIVLLEGGDVITADLRLIEASKLQTNESTLTGESMPVGKQTAPVDADAPLAERADMVYKGTGVTRGSGAGVVVATGMETELGQISSLVEEAEEEQTPLEKRLDQLARKLIWVTLGIAAFVAVAGILRGREVLLMIETSIALAVAAIPEGLPIVATIALARGMRRMAKRNALVNRLAAVETLGGTSIICTDKTGTLTENRMTATQYRLADGRVDVSIDVSGHGLDQKGEFTQDGHEIELNGDVNERTDGQDLLRRNLEIGVFCNNASLPNNGESSGQSDGPSGGDTDKGDTEEANKQANEDAIGDPVEVALLIAGAKAGLRRVNLLAEAPEAREVAFDPAVKMMATFHEQGERYRVAVKGAPEAVLEHCARLWEEGEERALTDEERQQWQDRNANMAESGLRVLALAEKSVDDVDADPYAELTLLGLVGLLDPPRETVREAIDICKRAGVRVVMVTGDQAATARNVAIAVGLVDEGDAAVIQGRTLTQNNSDAEDERRRIRDAAVLARVSPEQKLNLIQLYQDDGAIVAMTGDGVNDAPALKKADIGIAMGKRGTQVAREAADMVLTDDSFATIVAAIEQGRAIFDNIRKFVLYLLSCNISEIMTVGLASLFSIPLPILPLQILFLNLVTDVFPALALGVGEGDDEAMQRPPRDPSEAIVTRRHWMIIGGYGALITAAVLASLSIALWGLDMERQEAVTISFLTLAFAQLWHVFNMRDAHSGFLRNEITRNLYVWGALALCVVLLLFAVYLPVVASVLSITPPSLAGWALVLGLSLVPLVVGQMLKPLGIGIS